MYGLKAQEQIAASNILCNGKVWNAATANISLKYPV